MAQRAKTRQQHIFKHSVGNLNSKSLNINKSVVGKCSITWISLSSHNRAKPMNLVSLQSCRKDTAINVQYKRYSPTAVIAHVNTTTSENDIMMMDLTCAGYTAIHTTSWNKRCMIIPRYEHTCTTAIGSVGNLMHYFTTKS